MDGTQIIIKLLLILLAFASAVQAVPRLMVAAHDRMSYVTTANFSAANPPLIFSNALGAHVAYWLTDDFFLGAATEFTFFNQYSAVDSTVGNSRGFRWNAVSPVIGWRVYREMTFRAEVEFLGDYQYSNSLSTGGTQSLKNPLGVKLSASMPVFYGATVGLTFEYLTYNVLSNSLAGDSTLTSRIAFWSTGLELGYRFEFL